MSEPDPPPASRAAKIFLALAVAFIVLIFGGAAFLLYVENISH